MSELKRQIVSAVVSIVIHLELFSPGCFSVFLLKNPLFVEQNEK